MLTYHPSLKCCSCIVKGNLNILQMSWEAKTVFSPGPTLSIRKACKISS